jgi:hypothetical protein
MSALLATSCLETVHQHTCSLPAADKANLTTATAPASAPLDKTDQMLHHLQPSAAWVI